MPTPEQHDKLIKALEDSILFYEPLTLSLDSKPTNYPGSLDFKAILQGKANIFKIRLSENTLKEKKLIVITDWTLSENYDESASIRFLKWLIDLGFTVTYFNGKEIVPIKSATIKDLLSMLWIKPKPVSNKKIHKILAESNIPSEAILNLDYLNMRELLSQKFRVAQNILEDKKSYTLPPVEIDEPTLKKLEAEDLANFEECLAERKFTYNINIVSEHNLRFLKNHKSSIVGLLIHTANTSEKELFPHITNLKTIEIYNRGIHNWAMSDITDDDFIHLEELKLGGVEIEESTLIRIMNNATKLRTLKLINCTIRKDNHQLELKFLKNLHEINFAQVTLSFSLAASILECQQCPNISLLSLSVTHEPEEIIKVNWNFEHLASLKLRQIESQLIHTELFERLNITATKLSSLHLEDIKYHIHILEHTKLISLKSLHLENMNNKHRNDLYFLAALLNQNGQLENITLQNFRGLVADLTYLLPENLTLPNIKELSFDHTNLTMTLNSCLLIYAAATGINKIDLRFMQLDFPQHRLDSIKPLQLEHIHKINAQKASIPSSTLTYLLSRCEHLEELNLKEVTSTFFIDDEALKSINFKSLKNLNLANTYFTPSFITSLLERSPNLEKLNLTGCIIVDKALQRRGNVLNNEIRFNSNHQLKEFKYDYISLLSLIRLAEISDCVSEIPLDKCAILDISDIDFKTFNLDKIKHLSFDYSKSDEVQVLLQLLPLCKNLESVKNVCKSTHLRYQINTDQLPSSLSLPHLKSLDLEYVPITGKTIIKIIKNSTELEKLNINSTRCEDLTPQDVTALDLPQLESISSFDSGIEFLCELILLTKCKPRYRKTSREEIYLGLNFHHQTFKIPSQEKFPPTLGVQFHTVKSLSVDRSDGPKVDAIYSIIESIPNLECLKIIDPTLDFRHLAISPDSIPNKLKIFSIKTSCLSPTVVELFILRNQSLREVSIQITDQRLSQDEFIGLREIIDKDYLESINFNELVSLYMHGMQLLSERLFYHIFNTANNLIKIKFEKGTICMPNEVVTNLLENIEMDEATINGSFYSLFLNNPKLLKLNLNHCKINNASDKIHPIFNCPSLETIEIIDSNFDGNILLELLIASTKLTRLTLIKTSDKHFINSVFNKQIFLPNLTHLQIGNQTLPSNFFHFLSITFPNLQTLRLYHCQFIPPLIWLIVHPMSKLKTLFIKDCKLTNMQLSSFLAKTENLNELYLDSCVMLDNHKKIDKNISLPFLKDITVKASVISVTFLYSILNDNNSVKKLNLASSSFIYPTSLNSLSLRLSINNLKLNDFINESNLTLTDSIKLHVHSETSTLTLKMVNDNLIDYLEKFKNEFSIQNLKNTTNLILRISKLRVDKLINLIDKMQLTTLTLEGCTITHSLTDAAIKQIASRNSLNSLTKLVITKSDPNDSNDENNASGKAEIPGSLFIALLLASSKDLQEIFITGVAITSLTIDDIPPTLFLPNVTKFDLVNTGLSKDVIDELVERMPKYQRLKTANKLQSSSSNSTSANDSRLYHDILQRLNADPQGNFSDRELNDLSDMMSRLRRSSKSMRTNELSEHISDLRGQHKRPNAADSKLGSDKMTPSSKDKTHSVNLTYESKPGEEVELKAKQYFRPPEHPAKYRLHPGSALNHHGKIATPILDISDLTPVTINMANNKSLLELDFVKLFAKNPDHYRLFNKKMTITHTWRPLPSLSAFEEIQNFHIPNPELYDIKYSKKNNFYFIRLKNSVKQKSMSKVEVSYILDKDKFKPSHVDKKLPQQLQDLINYCSNFKEGIFTVPPEFNSKQILDKRYADHIGACDIRSLVFKYKFDQMKAANPTLYKDFECRYISNKIHAFVEIVKNGYTIPFDLRGYPAKLKIDDSFNQADSLLAQIDQAIETIELEQMSETQHQEMRDSFAVSLPPMPPKPIEEKDLNPKLAIWRKANRGATKEKIIGKFTKNRKNTLVKVNQADDCLVVIADFNQKKPDIPYFLIDSPDDLQINSKGLKNEDQNRLKVNQKFTQLSEFIKNNPNGVIFINWSRFSKTELTALHCILDKKRTLEGSPFAPENPIVSFYCDNIANPYKGLDFTSRHQHIFRWPGNEERVDLYNQSKQEIDHIKDNVISVPLYESQDWENLLFGAINIKDKTFQLHPEKFLLENSPLKSLHLINPPWKLRAFDLFWQSALQQRKFVLYGKTYELAKDFKLSYSYNKTCDAQAVVDQLGPDAKPLIVNSQTIPQLWLHYIYSEHSFLKQPSLFKTFSEERSNNEFSLTITETLSLQNWIRLLDEANKYKVKLTISLTEGVELPSELQSVPHQKVTSEANALQSKNDLERIGITVIEAPNTKEIIHEILRCYPSAKHIALAAPHDFGDLFYHIHSNFDHQDHISAELIESDIWKMLQAGKTVIVEGELSPLLMQTLAPLLCHSNNEIVIEGVTHTYTGKLIFVTNSKVSFAKQRYTCHSKEEIRQCLALAPENEKSALEKNESAKGQDEKVYSPTDLSQTACEQYKNERFHRIIGGFEKSPLIFYNGSTGIGKTTYILNDFINEYEQKTGRKAQLYIGEAQIKAFAAHDDSKVDPILFIDEANLSTQDLSILKGLKSTKKHALIGGKYYPLDNNDNAKVILAGNKKNYGGVRQQQSFLDEYTVEVECDRPNNAYNYHTILKPILSDTMIDVKASSSSTSSDSPEMDVANTILDLFNKVNELAAQPDPYFTPRHLHMIAKVFQYYFTRYHQYFDKRAIAAASVLAILGDDLSKIHSNLNLYINEKYAINSNDFRKFVFEETQAKLADNFPPTYKEDYFTFTESRIPAIHMMDIFLHLRESPDFHFGIALEGSTSNGKSDLLHHYIASQYPNDVVQMTLGTNFESDRETILAAFHAGKVLIIDEINAGGPKYEKLFNTLIMGTDEEGNPPTQRGFLVLTTQNSLTNEGRQALSPAIKARFTSLLIPKYKYSELEQILTNKGVARNAAKSLVRDYTLCIQYAKEHKIKLRPKLRNLLKACDFKTIHRHASESTTSENLAEQNLQVTTTTLDTSNLESLNEEPSAPSLQDLIDQIENQIYENVLKTSKSDAIQHIQDNKETLDESGEKELTYVSSEKEEEEQNETDLFLNETFIEANEPKPRTSPSKTSRKPSNTVDEKVFAISHTYANAVQILSEGMDEVKKIYKHSQSMFSLPFSRQKSLMLEYGKKIENIVLRFEIMLESVINEYNSIQDYLNAPLTLRFKSETAIKLREIADKSIQFINAELKTELYHIFNDPFNKCHIKLQYNSNQYSEAINNFLHANKSKNSP